MSKTISVEDMKKTKQLYLNEKLIKELKDAKD